MSASRGLIYFLSWEISVSVSAEQALSRDFASNVGLTSSYEIAEKGQEEIVEQVPGSVMLYHQAELISMYVFKSFAFSKRFTVTIGYKVFLGILGKSIDVGGYISMKKVMFSFDYWELLTRNMLSKYSMYSMLLCEYKIEWFRNVVLI